MISVAIYKPLFYKPLSPLSPLSPTMQGIPLFPFAPVGPIAAFPFDLIFNAFCD
jgi:hypothetical protein